MRARAAETLATRIYDSKSRITSAKNRLEEIRARERALREEAAVLRTQNRLEVVRHTAYEQNLLKEEYKDVVSVNVPFRIVL